MDTKFNSGKKTIIGISEVSFSRMVDFHAKNGYIMVSASRSENSDTENKKLDKQLKKDIQTAGWTYTPIFGGFVETNKETGEKTNVVERSFIVYNHNKDESKDFASLQKFAIEMCKKYKQEAVLVADPTSKTVAYYDEDGEKTFDLSKNISVRNSIKEFFSTLNRSKKNIERSKFSFQEVECCTIVPSTINGLRSAKILGEAYPGE